MRLGRREQLMIIAGGVVVALLLFYRLGLSPALERLRALDRLVAVKERELHQMRTLQATYVTQKRLMEDVSRGLAQRGPDFAIFSFLEELAKKAGIKDNIKSMTLPGIRRTVTNTIRLAKNSVGISARRRRTI